MIKITLLSAILIFVLYGCNSKNEKAILETEVEKTLQQLTLLEKVNLCHAQSKFSSKGVARLGIPEVWMSDGPHGVRAEINWDNWGHAGWTNDSCTAFPALTCLAATFNEEMSYKYGLAIGEEARYRDKDILLGPGVNIYRTPLNGRNFEYLGEDPYLASIMCVPYIQGVQANGVAACVKHYALNNQEKWRGHINVNISDRALREIYLPAYKAAVQKGGAWAFMGAYNKFRGQHCCHNEELNKILKVEWGFDGVFVSDWGGVHNAEEAALNGLDIEMGTWTDGLTTNKANAYNNYYLADAFYSKLKNGEIDESIVNDKARRVLRLIYRTGLNTNRPNGSFASPEHFAVARKIAQEGIVLLKNDNNFFPLNPDSKLKIAVIGENATRLMTVGGGSSELKTNYEISPLEGIKARFKNAEISYTKGYAAGVWKWRGEMSAPLNADSLKNEAIKIAKDADVVLFIGGLNKNPFQDTEGVDRKSLNLSYGQDELIAEILKVNNKVGVILISGNAVAMPWIDGVSAVMQAWYLGSEAGNAIADVISGDVNPSGKLPFTFPVKLEDNAAISSGELSYPGDSVNQYYKEDILVGYRWHDTKQIKPLFAFGHGLSYSKFTIDNCTLNSQKYSSGDVLTTTCSVNNTSNIDGSEVVQIYVGKTGSAVERAVKELKGFKKVKVKANSKTEVSVSINIDDLAYWNEEKSGWELEKGDYFVAIGNASDNISKQLVFSVK